jgi:hypothetical protein
MIEKASAHHFDQQVFTNETGAQAFVNVNPNHRVTIGLTTGNSSDADDIDIEVALQSLDVNQAPITYLAAHNVLASADLQNNKRKALFTIDAPAQAVRLNIVSNNSNDIVFEVVTGSY